MQCHGHMTAIACLVWPQSTQGPRLMLSTLDGELSWEEEEEQKAHLMVTLWL